MSREPLRAKASQPNVDTRAAAVLLGVKDGTIRSLASRGVLPRKGTDARRRTLYAIEDLYEIRTRRLATDPGDDDGRH